MRKILHVPYTFWPDAVGGTEIYVQSLVECLRDLGFRSVIAAPGHAGGDNPYARDGISVHRFATDDRSSNLLRELYGEGDPAAAAVFDQILQRERPDLVHMHAFSRGASVLAARAVKKRGIPLVFTYHTPAASCHRGTLMIWGEAECDGALRVRRCTACALQWLGVPRPVGELLARAPIGLAKTAGRMGISGSLGTGLQLKELMRLRHDAFRSFLTQADAVVALRDWVRSVLVRNGVPDRKIVSSAHGLGEQAASSHPHPPDQGPLRVAFLGRADEVKGVDTLIRAVRQLPAVEMKLDLYGVAQSAANETYSRSLRALADGDRRIRFLSSVPNDAVVDLLANYHVLAVPSRWMETGPLVVLEAFDAKTPVIGSRLGGIAEWVEDGVNGLLVAPESVDEWAAALTRCATDKSLIRSLRLGIKKPRRMSAVAEEMAALYQRCIAGEQGRAEDPVASVLVSTQLSNPEFEMDRGASRLV
jgi:glycosyltransferase involved in cell wall biosynthesis